MVYQLKIKLLNVSKPPVWRRVEVPSTCSLDTLHQVIQTAMGWFDEHLYHFYIPQARVRVDCYYELPNEDDDLFPSFCRKVDSRKVSLEEVFAQDKVLRYEYDFGDGWEHSIELEDVREGDAKQARCTAGKGQCPMEDCGGPYTYQGAKEALANEQPGSEANEDACWILGIEEDDEFDPSQFDPSEFDLENTDARVREVPIKTVKHRASREG